MVRYVTLNYIVLNLFDTLFISYELSMSFRRKVINDSGIMCIVLC